MTEDPYVVQTLYFSEYDLAFFKTRGEMMRHLRKCKLQHPHGDEIYRCHYPGGRSVSMFEVCSVCCLKILTWGGVLCMRAGHMCGAGL